MKFYIGVTDPRWFSYLSHVKPEDVNFWRPGAVAFKAIDQGAPFIFKLKGKVNKIVGMGFFYQYIRLPITVAWDTFGNGNGFEFFSDFALAIEELRGKNRQHNSDLGCIVLTNPIFFDEQDWVDVPSNWKSNIVSGSTYSTDNEIGRTVWRQIELRLPKYLTTNLDPMKSLAMVKDEKYPDYNLILTKVRIGQGAFRASVTGAYQKKCSITGERTLPVLEAAHIKSYSKSGPNLASNGLLLRSDLHKLFDTGYLTITPDLRIEVSGRIRAEFENGKEYYKLHGHTLLYVPSESVAKPRQEYFQWHNENVFRS